MVPGPALELGSPADFDASGAFWLAGNLDPPQGDPELARDVIVGVESGIETFAELGPVDGSLSIRIIHPSAQGPASQPTQMDSVSLPMEYTAILRARMEDLDGDDRQDLLLVTFRETESSGFETSVLILWNDDGCEQARFCSQVSTTLETNNLPGGIAALAVDAVPVQMQGDGRPEIAILHYAEANNDAIVAGFTLSETNPRRYTPVDSIRYRLRYPATSINSGDFNGDGLSDLVLGFEGLATVVLQQPAEARGTRLRESPEATP